MISDVMSWRDRAIGKIEKAFQSGTAERLRSAIGVATLCNGSEAVFRRIAGAATSEAMLDHFAEIRFGSIFHALRFEVEFEPHGRKGPDILVRRDGHSTCVEVKRFRPSLAEDDPIEGIGDELMLYGNLQKSVKTVEDELAAKFRQVEAGNGIVGFWSDHCSIEDIDFELAIRNMRGDYAAGVRRIPHGILFCIFASDWMNARGQQLYCEPLKPLSEPFSTWIQELKRFPTP